MWYLIIALLVVAAIAAYRYRVKILAKVLGQSEHRIDRHLNGPQP